MMILDLINKKKNGLELTEDEIKFFVNELVQDKIPDYQTASLLMAIWCKGMSDKETSFLTLSMVNTGEIANLDCINGIKVDKHSSGGVSDTTTIVMAPIVAACGGHVAKMSGRGLGHSGGTLDKLEAIPGFRVDLSLEEFTEVVNTVGCSIVGQTSSLAPADKRLYSLRDVTGTVDCIPLIASSIMSKKLAAGTDKILLDVKWGNGAFMPDVKSATVLGETMVAIGKHAGKETQALITNMNQPLGNAVGNSLEIIEGIEILKGKIKGDLTELIFELSARMLVLAEVYKTKNEAMKSVKKSIEDGSALAKFGEMIAAHGGDSRVIEDYSLLPTARYQVEEKATKSGYISHIATNEIGMSTVLIGAGRIKKSDEIDYSSGLVMHKRLGDKVKKGDVLCTWHANDLVKLDEARGRFIEAITISEKEPKLNKLISTGVE